MTTFAQARARVEKASRGSAKPQERRGIMRSAELSRIASLPRRSADGVYDVHFAHALSVALRREGSDFELKPKQAAMLVEAVEAGGLFGMVGVGVGKTTIAPLFGKVMDIESVVLLVPPAIKREIVTRVIPWISKHIDFIPPTVISYSELSTAGKSDLLDRLQPRMIVVDEAHNLKNKNAARTKRFLRYFDENPATILVALSGTMARRSIMDFHHIIELTHRDWRMPLTRQWREAKDWSLALDPQVHPSERLHPGALLELCIPGEDVRSGFRRRLVETEGVIGGSAEDVGASLVMRRLTLELPAAVRDALSDLRKKWVTPGGEQITDALDFARKARELAQGFYYVWEWPGGEPDVEWLERRAAWRKCVADVCRLNRAGLDSELLVRNAAERELKGTWKNEDARLPKAGRKEIVACYSDWIEVKDTEEPPVRAVWIDDFAVRAALAWGKKIQKEGDGALIWYDARAIEERATELGALVCGAGTEGNRRLLELAEVKGVTPPVVFVSANAHGTGKNLQRWCRNLAIAPWPAGAKNEQIIGRTHRPYQEADEVTFDVFVHTDELERAMDAAIEDAHFIKGITGGDQKLLQATWLGSKV